MSALSAVEMALWDIKGKALGIPVYQLLGGKVRDSVPCYANGWFAPARMPAEFAEKAQAAVGDSVDLLIEGHGRFNVGTAVRIARELERFDILWFEEPVPPDNLDALLEVKQRSRVPIGADYLIYDPAASKMVMNYVNDPYTLAGGENVLTPVGGFVAGTGNANFNVTNSMILYALNTPVNRFDNAIAGSKFRVPSTRFTNQSDAPTLDQHYKDVQATIDHRFGPVFLQAAVDINRTRAQTINIDVNGVGQTYIDINSLLPNGAANPHFLEPYGDAPIRRSKFTRDAEGSRLALGYAKDAGKWGNYTINAIASANPLGDTSVNGRNKRTFENVPAVFVDMQDREARGYELELTANLSRQWRLTFNVGLPKVYSTNAARDQIKFYDANKAMLKQIVIDAGGLVDASDVASVDTSIAVNDRSPDVNAAVNSYNSFTFTTTLKL
jgi:hypothetical protein